MTDYPCSECENVYNTAAEADACCTLQGAILDDEPCLADGTPLYPARRLTRQERLQGLADRGIDTWDDYRGER